jgi:hypothetical protein
MAVDGRSRPADVPGEGGAAGQADVDGAPGAAETRSRAEYYAALRAADPDRPPRPESLRLEPDRAAHILDGDDTGGGHRSGTGRPGKTEFPADWNDHKITEHVTDVAKNPDRSPVHQAWNDRWLARGQRDGVDIVVIAQSDGRIWTAWPLEGGAGVVRNPKEVTA